MNEALERMTDEDVHAMIGAIVRCATPWSADILATSSAAIDALGAELLRRRADRPEWNGDGAERR